MTYPTLRQLEFLCAVSDHGSFSRAAEAAHVTQPTLSSAIKEVESLLGVKLVERQSRGVTLTAAGQTAVMRARTILADAAELVAAARQSGAPLTGSLRLGAIPTIAPFLLPGTLKALREAYPRLKLFLREDQTERLLADLKSRKLDLALIALPWDMTGIETLPLCEDEFLLVAPPEHHLMQTDTLRTHDLTGEDVLLLEDGHCLRTHALSVCRLPAGHNGADVTATSLATLVHMVAGDLGVSLLPQVAVNGGVTRGADVATRAFDQPLIGRQIGLAWRKGSAREEEARLMAQLIRQIL